MAFSATTIWQAQTDGADGTAGNGGGFDPANANMATDLAATLANTAAPVVTSASYTFIARDVGSWLFVKAGTSWIAGFYQIASVAGGAATLNATIGSAVVNYMPSLVVGCATVASPTSGTWSVDYSQQAAAGITYADALVDAVTNTNFTSAAFPVGPNIVGNVIAFSAGNLWTVQRVQVVSVAGTVATCDKALGTVAGVNGVGKLGGALASPGQAGALMVINGNALYIKSGTYTITSATPNIAAGCLSTPGGATAGATRVIGYGTVRGDGTRPTLILSGVSGATILTLGTLNHIEHLILDAATLATSKGLSVAAGGFAYKIKLQNNTSSSLSVGNFHWYQCEMTSSSSGWNGGTFLFCSAHDNTGSGFNLQNSSGSFCYGCISANNTGVGSDGFVSSATAAGGFVACTAYGNGRAGFRIAGGGTANSLAHCLATNNGGYGFDASAAGDNIVLVNCAGFSNTNGNVNLTNISPQNVINFIALTSTPFVNAALNNFALNSNAGGGAALAGFPRSYPGLSTSPTGAIGAAAVALLGAGSVLRRRVTRRC